MRWARGHLEFFSPPAFTLMSSSMGGGGGWGNDVTATVHDAMVENDVAKELMSVGGQVNANLCGSK